MTPLEDCKDMTNPKLLIEIRNRDAMMQTKGFNNEALKAEINELWLLMQKNGYKR